MTAASATDIMLLSAHPALPSWSRPNRAHAFKPQSMQTQDIATKDLSPMTDITPKAVYQEYKDDNKRGPLHGPLFWARAIAIVAAVGGAVPTCINLYHSWAHGIPYDQVGHRLAQYDLWMKNFDCKIDYRALNTTPGTRVDVGACNKSGDIAIKITSTDGKSAYEWIAFNQLQKSGQSFSLFNLIATEAHADELSKSAPASATPTITSSSTPRPLVLAQAAAGMQVMCQIMPEKGKILRVVQEGGKCFREDFSAFKGKVEKRDEVPCNTQCTPGAAAPAKKG
ncbi:MAG: hypothetical protein ABL898_16420 [Hyphomicrobiaceae bacterium]